MKIHTEGMISMGRGAAMSKSSKQKINTNSSREAEVVGTSNYILNKLWENFSLITKVTSYIIY